MGVFNNRPEPLVPLPDHFPRFEAAVQTVQQNRPAHQRGRVDAFYTVWDVARAVPQVAEILGISHCFDHG